MGPVLGTNYTADEIVEYSNGKPWNACMWDHSTIRANHSHPGAEAYFRSVVALWEEWGLDLVKIDCVFGDYDVNGAIATYAKVVNESKREIIISLSPGDGTTPELIQAVARYATMGRATTDLHNNWPGILGAYDRAATLATAAWESSVLADLDCLPFSDENGRAAGGDLNNPADMRNVMTLWSIARSPLFLGGDPRTPWPSKTPGSCPFPDNITYHCGVPDKVRDVLTNDIVLKAAADIAAPQQLSRNGTSAIWVAHSAASPSARYLALFNLLDNQAAEFSVPITLLNITSPRSMKELWTGASSKAAQTIQHTVAPRDAAFFSLAPA